MAQLHFTNCDVCSEEMLSQAALMNHIQLHLSQFNRLINRSLSHYFAELDDNVGTDADSDHSTTPPEKKTPAKRLKVWKCPCKTCDHGAFRRKQELVQHYATHYMCDWTCICSITFHLGGKYLYHNCKAGQSTKDRWVLLRPELERVLNEAMTKANAGSRRRVKSATRPVSLRSHRRASSNLAENPPRDRLNPTGIRPQVLN